LRLLSIEPLEILKAMRCVDMIVADHWPAICRVAALLLDGDELSGRDVNAIMYRVMVDGLPGTPQRETVR
jgi:hypothetical protein